MRLAGVALLLLFPSLALAAPRELPYTAYIAADDVYVRSGPGKNYYPTQKLPLGEAIEVYRHDPGGWLAIRPPKGSFCWISSRFLRTTDEPGIAVVDGDRVVARVGSTFSDVRDVIQVRLERGETVEVLETAEFGLGPDRQAWCKIAPPAGEFRWVSADLIEGDEGAAVRKEEPRRLERLEEAEPSDSDERGEVSDENVRLAAGQEYPSDRAPTRVARSERPLHAEWDSQRRTAAPATAATQPKSLAEEIEAIDLELSRMVVEEPTVWSFTQLRARTESTLDRCETAVERGKARLVLNKIERFETIKQSYKTLVAEPAVTPEKSATVEAIAIPREQPNFDGQGILTPVVSRRVGAPTFALVDARNQVQFFVTPLPGVNLRPYVGQRIGVTGQRGFLTELDKPHVTAARATVLDKLR